MKHQKPEQVSSCSAGAGQFAVPTSRNPAPALISTAAGLQPHTNLTVQQQQPVAVQAGQGIGQQPQPSLQQSAPPMQAAASAVPVDQAQAQPADSTLGGSVLSGSGVGTEEERLERKRQRQLEKQRIK